MENYLQGMSMNTFSRILSILLLLSALMITMYFLSCSGGNKKNQPTEEDRQDSIITSSENTDKTGENLYLKYCMPCHQTDGSGAPGMYPPLINSPVVNSGNKDDFINVMLNGLKGPIVVHGKKYNQQMPSQSFLKDEEIAEIINYVSRSFQNNGPEVTPDGVKALRP